MADIVPIKAGYSRTETGTVVRITVPKEIREDPALTLDLKKQLYMRITVDGHGLLITDRSNGKLQ